MLEFALFAAGALALVLHQRAEMRALVAQCDAWDLHLLALVAVSDARCDRLTALARCLGASPDDIAAHAGEAKPFGLDAEATDDFLAFKYTPNELERARWGLTDDDPPHVSVSGDRVFAGGEPVASADELDLVDEGTAARVRLTWVVRLEVAGTWIADGFDLDDERAASMLAHDLAWACGDELGAAVLRRPEPAVIRALQGDDADGDLGPLGPVVLEDAQTLEEEFGGDPWTDESHPLHRRLTADDEPDDADGRVGSVESDPLPLIGRAREGGAS